MNELWNVDWYKPGFEGTKYHIPLFLGYDNLGLAILNKLKSINVENRISLVYGSPNTIWNTGRISNYVIPIKTIENYVKAFNDFGVSCALTANNYNILDKDLSSRYPNQIMEIMNAGKNNYIIVASEKMREYIRNTYPNIKIISSLNCMSFGYPNYDEPVEIYNEMLDRYDMVVVRTEMLKRSDDIVKINDKDRCEILCNQYCQAYCPFVCQHQQLQEMKVRQDSKDKNAPCIFTEVHKDETDKDDYYPYMNNNLSMKMMMDLISMGFNTFKVQGRERGTDFLVNEIGKYVFDPCGPYTRMLTAREFDNSMKMFNKMYAEPQQ